MHFAQLSVNVTVITRTNYMLYINKLFLFSDKEKKVHKKFFSKNANVPLSRNSQLRAKMVYKY